MGSLADAFAWADQQVGKPYDASSDAVRFGPDRFDCSGFQTMFGVQLGQPRGSLPTNSADLARWLEGPGAAYRLPIDAAKNTPGTFLIYGGINGYGPKGHVVIVGPDRLTYEARGSGHGVGRWPVDRLTWSHAGRFPTLEQTGDDDMDPEVKAWVRDLHAAMSDDKGKLAELHTVVFAPWNQRLPNVLHDLHVAAGADTKVDLDDGDITALAQLLRDTIPDDVVARLAAELTD